MVQLLSYICHMLYYFTLELLGGFKADLCTSLLSYYMWCTKPLQLETVRKEVNGKTVS